MCDVLVVGAGPVGLTVAAELLRHGADCRVIDRQPGPSRYCRAIGVTPRTPEVWEDMGVVDAMMDAGIWLRGFRLVADGRLVAEALTVLDGVSYPTTAGPAARGWTTHSCS